MGVPTGLPTNRLVPIHHFLQKALNSRPASANKVRADLSHFSWIALDIGEPSRISKVRSASKRPPMRTRNMRLIQIE